MPVAGYRKIDHYLIHKPCASCAEFHNQLSDGVLLSDAILEAFSALMGGDPSAGMECEPDTSQYPGE